MAHSLEVVGSTVRDFCMLERNFLLQIKLVLLLMLLSTSVLLGTRLPGPLGSEETRTQVGLPTAIIQFLAALAIVVAAIWEYHNGVKSLLRVRAFFAVTRVHFSIMLVPVTMMVAIFIVYLVHS